MWQLEGHLARFTSPSLAATVDLRFPWRGLSDLLVDGRPLPGTALLRAETRLPGESPESLVEGYVRGCDLVATYAETPERPIRPQLYWRAIAPANGGQGFELVVSLQTDLLDSQPVLRASSWLPPCEAYALSDLGQSTFQRLDADSSQTLSGATRRSPLVLFRFPGGSPSYAEMMYPTDCGGVELLSGSATGLAAESTRLNWRMFDERLEKGVIRRGRLRGVFLPVADDQAAAVACFRDLLASAPPLTA